MALGDPIPIGLSDKIIPYRYITTMPIEERNAFYKQEARALLNWAKRSDSLSFHGFCSERGYSRSTFANFTKENPDMMEAHEMAKQVLVARYHTGGLTGKLHPNFTLEIITKIDEEYRQMCNEMNLNAETANSYENTQKRAIKAELELAQLKAKIKMLEEDDGDKLKNDSCFE